MGQFSLVVSSASDLAEFDIPESTGEYTTEIDSTPALKWSPRNETIWTTPGTSATVDFYSKWYMDEGWSGGRYYGPGVRLPDAEDDPTAYIVSRVTSDRVGLYRSPGNNVLALSSFSWPATPAFSWTRVKADGSSFKVKHWTGALSDEPGGLGSNTDWTIETTDSTYSSAGYVGHSGDGIANYSALFYISELYVGTDGDSAPVGGGSTTITGSGVVQGQTLAQATLTQGFSLAPASLAQAHALDQAALTQAHNRAA